ncbi:NAD-dependent epimerase/dehydratase family protein [Natrinema salifodinae]|uniref:UDP-glucose 4-epimerase n=1 Tax=Natrinema salifodinae TaxID=1202768 RepID=A0A1I0M842_9EURY|nr:NAD(P)-dependent oxidoreductase [Natrinema salifodinae]SEV83886.1 UDP-glucose 4-epimerase [Natrinema salifodinae]
MNAETTDEYEPRIAVTGAAGYIGSRVVEQLRATHPEWELVALDNQFRGQVDAIGDVSIRHVDVRDRRSLEDALADADIVLHLAALSGVDDCESNRDLAYEVNVQGTNNVAWFCRRTGAGMVFPFSMASIGDPQSFPITADHPREPLNWYGRTKVLGERAVASLAEGAFPAHCYMKSNLYGAHELDGTRISKSTVINFFVDRVAAGEPLTVYEPGTQSRNFVHVKDVARAYIRSAERLVTQLDRGDTGVETYEIASDEDRSVMAVAELVRSLAREELGIDPNVELIENPRGNETLVEDFAVDITRSQRELNWEPRHSVAESVRQLLNDHA